MLCIPDPLGAFIIRTSVLIFTMDFASLNFLFIFLPVFFTVYWLVPHHGLRNGLLLLGSAIFLAAGELIYFVLILVLIAGNYLIGLQIVRALSTERPASRWVWLGVSLNIATLLAFKFLNTYSASLLPYLPPGAAPVNHHDVAVVYEHDALARLVPSAARGRGVLRVLVAQFLWIAAGAAHDVGRRLVFAGLAPVEVQLLRVGRPAEAGRRIAHEIGPAHDAVDRQLDAGGLGGWGFSSRLIDAGEDRGAEEQGCRENNTESAHRRLIPWNRNRRTGHGPRARGWWGLYIRETRPGRVPS